MKMKQLFAAALLLCTTGAWAQTDVTSTYLTNADFSESTPIASDLRGYGKDMVGSDVYGLQEVEGWTLVATDVDNSTEAFPNSGVAAAVFEYGSAYQMKGNNITAPAVGPDGGAGNGLGFFAVWTCGGYYYQDVTLPAGNYTLTFTIYNVSGEQAETSYTGFFPTEGEAKTVAVNTTIGQWVNQTVSFKLTEDTPGQIRLGYRSTGNGSKVNPHIFFDCVKISGVTDMDLAIDEALAALPATGGDNFFTMSQETIDAFKKDIEDATTVEAVENIKANIEGWTAPALSGKWNILNATAAAYLGVDGESVVLSASPVDITFEKATSGYYIKAGESYINMKGDNKWNMMASETPSTEWTFNPADGKYTIKGPNGVIGTDNTSAGSICYGDKTAGNNGLWTISAPMSEEEKELAIAKNTLEAALKAAVVPTANIGTGVFQYKSDEVEAFASKVADAQAVFDNVASTAAELNAQTEILALSAPTLNAPAEGQLFNLILTYKDYQYDNKAVTFIANGRTDAGNYNIQYLAEANTNLAQAFTLTQVEGNNYLLSQIDADGVARYVSTGTIYGGNANQLRTTINEEEAAQFTIIATNVDGVYNIKNVEANNFVGSQDAGFFTVNSHIDFKIVETQKASVTINTTEAGWGTVMLPFAAAVPEGLKAYTVESVNGDGKTLAFTAADAFEANKPYVVEGEVNVTLDGDAQGAALTYNNGILTGTYAQADAPVDSYVLQNLTDGLGFYVVAAEKQPKVEANHAWLTVPKATVKAFLLGSATGVQSVKNAEQQNAAIFNLAGQRVNKAQKGIFIQNGKKVVIK